MVLCEKKLNLQYQLILHNYLITGQRHFMNEKYTLLQTGEELAKV
jgi:hypothetical protein